MKPERMWELFEKHANFGRDEYGIANFDQFSAAIFEAVAETIKRCAQDKVTHHLVELYRLDPKRVADICDESLDRTGNLLGYLRDAARALPREEKTK